MEVNLEILPGFLKVGSPNYFLYMAGGPLNHNSDYDDRFGL